MPLAIASMFTFSLAWLILCMACYSDGCCTVDMLPAGKHVANLIDGNLSICAAS